MADEGVIREKLRLLLGDTGGDVKHAVELYHDDAVLEFPQSGERFDGRDRFTEWRSMYPAEVSFNVQRVTIRDDLAVVELTARYDSAGPLMFGVSLMEFRGDRIARERIYVAEGWDPPEWRAPFRSENAVETTPF